MQHMVIGLEGGRGDVIDRSNCICRYYVKWRDYLHIEIQPNRCILTTILRDKHHGHCCFFPPKLWLFITLSKAINRGNVFRSWHQHLISGWHWQWNGFDASSSAAVRYCQQWTLSELSSTISHFDRHFGAFASFYSAWREIRRQMRLFKWT